MLLDAATHLDPARFDRCVILRHDDPMADHCRAAGIECFQVRLVPSRGALKVGRQMRRFGSFPFSVRSIARILKRWRADVVHVNTLHHLQAAVAARWARIPLVWHMRELGDGALADRARLAMVQCLATRATAVSSAVADAFAGAGDPVHVVPDGIDLSEYAREIDTNGVREELGAPQHAPLILVIGRIEPGKGQHVALEAMPAVVQAFPDAVLAFVGSPAPGVPHYLNRLEARCSELGLSDNVLFPGTRCDIPRLLAAANILVLPTAAVEPFGRPIVEAMAAGCPTVASAAGGPLELIEDGVTGLLVPRGEPQALSQAVTDLLREPERARIMARNARVAVSERFPLERMLEQLQQVLVEAAHARR